MNRVYQGNKEVIQKIKNSFDKEYFVQPPQYSNTRIKYDDCIITIYDSGKVMFQGANAGIYAATFFPEKEITLPQCGSDEVGTGDYFGPVCVCACCVQTLWQAAVCVCKVNVHLALAQKLNVDSLRM